MPQNHSQLKAKTVVKKKEKTVVKKKEANRVAETQEEETMQTMQQQRAKFALEGVKRAAERLNRDAQGEYCSHVAGLPFMIHANGLGQAAAFYSSKAIGSGTNDYRLIYELLSDWLKAPGQPFEGRDLLEGITQCDMSSYLAAQAEAMVFMNWVRKFAIAFMQGDN
ncbi:CRISPR-associated Cmr5 family protein [Candidatus Thiomargarita nelsonii]|uniref:CRISPR type III-B/RAMP module-associated protein Cmr5 n=1 Tax=Candidatus Thiomargarita nelsonii TaxID=1003181 RepID=A0A176RUD4_9GAMM|nr:CRISPR-associated Cmr5 family protein [Candidatus Thiomargarita nelsonii]